jgi:undecaprenyl-diphosphatase
VPLWIALVLGVVEGLTEFLPVSSTGHLVLVTQALGVSDDAGKTFDVVIQAGAVVAVVVHFRALLMERIGGLVHREPEALKLFSALAVAFAPAAVVGFLFRKAIKAHLFAPLPIAAALFVGGVVMIVVDRWSRARKPRIEKLEDVGIKEAIVVGVAQVLSLWPGASRAMTTIVGGQLCGMSTAVAAEFSFLLALPTLGAATMFDAAKGGSALVATSQSQIAVAVGLVTSFLVSWAVIAAFLRWLRTRGLTVFGVYRMALAIAVFLWLKR